MTPHVWSVTCQGVTNTTRMAVVRMCAVSGMTFNMAHVIELANWAESAVGKDVAWAMFMHTRPGGSRSAVTRLVQLEWCDQ